MSPFIVLAIGVAFVVLAIAWLKIHPFFALVIAAVLVGVLSPESLARTPEEEALPQATLALQRTLDAFGELAGSIGIVIVLAAVIGQALMESGAADKITRRLLAVTGERHATWALLASGYLLSIPVFFDTVFFLLVPLARALAMRTGKNFVVYVLAISAGGVLTHGLVPPTPGPLAMASETYLDIPLGEAILGGFLLGVPVAILGGIFLPRLLAAKTSIPLRETAGSSLDDLRAIVDKPESELPGFLSSFAPVALPVVLITTHSIVEAVLEHQGAGASDALRSTFAVTSFLGDKLFALGLGTVIALVVLVRQKRWSIARLMESLEPALLAAGLIILITCAGGSFGKLIKATGIGDVIGELVGGGAGAGTTLLLVAWGLAAVLKVAQGSGTASMIVSANIMAGILRATDEATGELLVHLPYHRVYIFAAIAFGSMFVSWMNDSGFWVVCKMSGFTEKETLQTWTVLLGVMAVAGLAVVLIFAHVVPMAPDEELSSSAAGPALELSWADEILRIEGEGIPGGPVEIWYIEAYCRSGSTDRDWAETTIPHRTELVRRSADGTRLELRSTLPADSGAVVIDHVITAAAGEVDFRVTARNTSDEPVDVVWAQPCVRVGPFTGRDQTTYQEVSFIVTEDGPRSLSELPRATEARYTPGQVFVPAGVDPADVNPRPISSVTPANGLVGCLSDDGEFILGTAWEPYQELFQGIITCLHADFRLGGLAPGETRTARGKVWILRGDPTELMERYRRDFPPTS